MAGEQDQDDKTEDASERRIEQALERGDVPKSADLQGFLTLAAGAAAIAASAGAISPEVARRLSDMLGAAHVPIKGMPPVAEALSAAAMAVAAPMLAVLFAGVGASLIMHRPMLVTEPMAPKASRIDPLAGAKRLFGADNLVAFGKTLTKLSMVLAALYSVLWPERGAIVALGALDIAAGVGEGSRLAMRAVGAVLALYAAIAAFDAFYQRHSWRRRLRMSQQEVKDEHKEMEGNPEIKSRLRALRQQRMRRRMIAAVPEATLILVNPTHYSVALRYEKGMAAPRCVAKGVDELALRIREIAREHRIPVVANAPLARALHAAVDVDEDIPEAHYKAVAEVIGFILRARGKSRRDLKR